MEYINKVAVRLIDDGRIEYPEPISSPSMVKEVVADYIKDFDREVFGVISISACGVPINVNFVSMWDLCQTHVHPRETFKAAILSNAAAIITFHNHPSGSGEFSLEDLAVYRRLVKAGEIIGIKILDNIVVAGGKGDIFSMACADEGLTP